MAGLIEMNAFIGKFVRLWQSGRDANLKIESKAGQAVVSLQLDLGYPHPPPHHPVPVVRAAQVRRRQRRAAERQTAAEAESKRVEAEQADRDRAEAAQAEHKTVVTEHERDEAAKAARVEAEQARQALAVQAAPLDQDSCNIGNIPQLDGEPEEGLEENDGQEAFKCLQCKLLFIPGSHMHGNEIFDYESCRRHLGVNKCRNCALPLIGLDRMRAHLERCHEPA